MSIPSGLGHNCSRQCDSERRWHGVAQNALYFQQLLCSESTTTYNYSICTNQELLICVSESTTNYLCIKINNYLSVYQSQQ